MVKSSLVKHLKAKKSSETTVSDTPSSSSSSSCKYKGVRKRKWGKYVSEIRLPNSRERIWLGSYDTAEKAARAFDAALYCLRGNNAKFNFPDNPPEIAGGQSMTPVEIQDAAARFAHSDSGRTVNMDSGSGSGSDTTSSGDQVMIQSPCASVSGGVSVQQHMEGESTEMPLENAFLDQFLTLGTESNMHDGYGLFPGFDDLSGDYYLPPLPNVDYWQDNNTTCDQDFSTTNSSFLWNF